MHAPIRPQGVLSCRSALVVFITLFVIGLSWALYTQHVWEDFYITYRASKNLATGNGFTFTTGERVHSYTSPLGALLPAVASLLTGNKSDFAALWIFRLVSLVAFAAAGVVFWRLGRSLFSGTFSAVLLIALLATESKIIDFSTNGMETAFVLLFLGWTLYALLVSPPRKAVHLGLAWAGLLWSRPDSFIYIGVLALAVIVFAPFSPFWRGRWELLKVFFIAGAITTLVYGPWLLWAWSYYGSPIPHTIVAKGLLTPRVTPYALLYWICEFPFKVWRTGAGLGTTFLPAYGTGVGWPQWMVKASLYLSVITAVLWLVPRVRWEARVASVTFAAGHFYLSTVASFHSPWYVPTLTALAFVAISTVAGQLWNWTRGRIAAEPSVPPSRRGWASVSVAVIFIALPVASLAVTGLAAYQMRLSQRICETGHRRLLGLWLKENAQSPHDTVLLEPLGYIGFFSGLKMYDFPGLCSPEVVAARRKITTRGNYTSYFPELISVLEPDWVVLRAEEENDLKHFDRDLLTKYYTLRRTFDVRDQVRSLPEWLGRQYLMFDAYFAVYHRNDRIDSSGRTLRTHIPIRSIPVTVESLAMNNAWGGPAYATGGNIAAHAPSVLQVPIPKGAQRLIGRFGFFSGAYENPQDSTEGAEFVVTLIKPDGSRHQMFIQTLSPRDRIVDRGEHEFALDLEITDKALVELATRPPAGMGNGYGWTYWTNVKFDVPKPLGSSGE